MSVSAFCSLGFPPASRACRFWGRRSERGKTVGVFEVWIQGSSNQKVEPVFGLLSTPIFPCMRATSCRQMERPSPVPPYLRVVDPSACMKASKSFFCVDCGKPMPVSMTSKRSSARVLSCCREVLSGGASWVGASWGGVTEGTAETRTTTSPLLVNFTALLTRFEMIWRMRTGSPVICSGTSGSIQ